MACLARAGELEPVAGPAPDLRLGHAPPQIDPVDRAFLMRLVRRGLERQVRGEPPYAPAYIPPALHDLTCRAAVTLRRRGRLVGTGESEPRPVVDACRAALDAALARARDKQPITEADLETLHIEIELIGPRQRVGDGKDTPQQLALSFEPAVHGIAARFDGQEILIRPSQLISMESYCVCEGQLVHECDRYEMAIADLMAKLGVRDHPPQRDPEKVLILRFRTTHLYEPSPGAPPVHLIGGLRVVEPGEVTIPALTAAVDDLARYIRFRQNPDGLFSYEFLPGRSIYWPKEQNWTRQAATTWALALHARRRGDPASQQALQRALEAFRKMAVPVPGQDRARCIATSDGERGLGTSAMVALAIMDAPQGEEFADLRAALLGALAGAQREDGSFRTHFPPDRPTASQDYYPGEALLAIARQYAEVRDAKWREVCDRALSFYVAYFRANPRPSFIPWQAQAWGHLARTTRLQRYADFVYEMSDQLVATQIESPDPTLPIYAGGFDVYGEGRSGISTAVYLEGLTDAIRTAQVMEDSPRAERYREALRKGTRFVVQLRFRQEECYYVESPADVVGAVRNTPINPTLRIDHCQHALSALLGAIEMLSSPDSAPAGG